MLKFLWRVIDIKRRTIVTIFRTQLNMIFVNDGASDRISSSPDAAPPPYKLIPNHIQIYIYVFS